MCAPVQLKPQDILVLLKLAVQGQRSWSYAPLAVSLGMSPSQLHAAVRRALAAQLAVRIDERIQPNRANLEEFVIHGLRYVFPPVLGGLTRGMPTSHAGPALANKLTPSADPPPVWPDADGEIRGQSFSPLCKSVPQAARADEALYELLTLVDAIRGGRARDRNLAIKEIKKRLAHDD